MSNLLWEFERQMNHTTLAGSKYSRQEDCQIVGVVLPVVYRVQVREYE